MAKKKSWFNLVKRLFIWDTHSTQEKKEKRRKGIFGKLKTKKLPTITAPLPSKEITLSETEEEEQRKHGLTVTIASATGVKVAAEVVLLDSEESQLVEKRNEASESIYKCQKEIKESAAIKIQTAFRGYLAKKALRALKGIVKLQAIIRGRAVRRQAMSTLKCLQSIVSIQSKVCARRLQMAEGKWDFVENEEMQHSKDKIIRMDSNSEKKWDDSTLLKVEVDASCMIKKEAILKRERIRDYSFNHRYKTTSNSVGQLSQKRPEGEFVYGFLHIKSSQTNQHKPHQRSAESERSKVNGRWRYWLEQWVDTQLTKSKELEDLDSVFGSHSKTGEEFGVRQQQHKLRKSFPHKRQSSIGEDNSNSFSSSPVTPAYMAATESARAKARSTSSPKARNWNYDMNSDTYSPCKKKLSIVSSVNTEVLNNGYKMGKVVGYNNQQRSPSLKGISVPVKSSRSIKDLSINSDCSLPNWDRQSSFK